MQDRSSRPPPSRRSPAFLLIYALAYAGGVIGYLPLLTLLLPLKIERLAGDARLDILTVTVFAGATAASLANIAFGWLSDRSVARGGGRRRWLAGGLAATALAYAALAMASSPATVVLAVIGFQVAINAVLAPLLAIMADEVPDAQKGVAAGLLAMASPVASTVPVMLAGLGDLGAPIDFALVPVTIILFAAPLVATRARPAMHEPRRDVPAIDRRDLAIAWVARLLVQIAGNALFLYLLYYLESLSPDDPQALVAARMGTLMIVAYTLPLPIAVVVGRIADRTGRIRPLLFAAAIVAATGLVGMASAQEFAGGASAFCVYAIGASVFLALHAGFAMQVLPSARHRGRDLGVLNLTNTLPALLGPPLTWLLATPGDFDTLMLVLAALTAGGGIVILAARGHRSFEREERGDRQPPDRRVR